MNDKRSCWIKQGLELDEKVSFYTLTLTAVALFAVIAGLTIGFHLSRVITREFRESIAQLSSSSAEILATTTQVASGAAETAAAVSETTATVEEVKQTAQHASQKARYVSDSAQKASNVSQAGRKSVEEAIHGHAPYPGTDGVHRREHRPTIRAEPCHRRDYCHRQ